MKIDIAPLQIDKAVLCTLENMRGLRLKLSNFGAAIVSIEAPDRHGKQELVTLTHANIDDFFYASQFLGKTIGRTAGRIPDSMLKIGHQTYALESAFGRHTLHGGAQSLAFKLFTFKLLDFGKTTKVQFRYISPFGDGGYPGQVRIDVFYTLLDDENEVVIEYEAVTDFPTPLNLTNHTYFNLSGDLKSDVRGHILTMNTPLFFDVDDELLLTQQLPVTSIMDFRKGQALGAHLDDEKLQRSKAFGYDHTFKTNGTNVHAKLIDPLSGRQLTISADYPAINVYTNNYPSDKMMKGDIPDYRYAGVALEPQFVPKEQTSYMLEPEETYHHSMTLRFDIAP